MSENVEHLHEMIDALFDLSETEEDPFIKSIAAGGLKITEEALFNAGKAIKDFNGQDIGLAVDNLITPESLTEIAAIASEFDKTGDVLLVKQAAVLDEILLTIGAQRDAITSAKKAQDDEISRLKSLAAEKEKNKETSPYTIAKQQHDKENRVDEGKKALDGIKEYRPMEAPLNTRTCPDHPGAQMARIAEHTYQCSLDKAIYNYESGYTTMKGNKVPGGDVSNQTQSLYDRPTEFTSFDTRESRLNPT
jgi:hypothetical protein